MKVLTSRAGGHGVDDVAAVGAQHAALVGHADAGDALAQPVHRRDAMRRHHASSRVRRTPPT